LQILIKEKEKITHLIQVSLNLNDEKTKKREIRSLLKAKKELKCDCKLIILTLDEDEILNIENKTVYIKNVIKWLLF
jgi:predicted AAA+ superfamily ATPase